MHYILNFALRLTRLSGYFILRLAIIGRELEEVEFRSTALSPSLRLIFIPVKILLSILSMIDSNNRTLGIFDSMAFYHMVLCDYFLTVRFSKNPIISIFAFALALSLYLVARQPINLL
jgi:hypothetical protein